MKNTIPITSLCLDRRDIVFFLCFIYENNYLRRWRQFALDCRIDKVRKGMDELISTEKRGPQLTVNYLGRDYIHFINVVKSIKTIGQKTPIPVVKCDNKIYPCEGTKRTASIILLGIDTIEVFECLGGSKYFGTWQRDFSISGPYFQNMTKTTMEKFLAYRRILKERLYE